MIRKHSIFFVLLLLLIMPTSWAQERAIRPVETNVRQALVIGNSKYTHTGPLRNPANDAEAISSTLATGLQCHDADRCRSTADGSGYS